MSNHHDVHSITHSGAAQQNSKSRSCIVRAVSRQGPLTSLCEGAVIYEGQPCGLPKPTAACCLEALPKCAAGLLQDVPAKIALNSCRNKVPVTLVTQQNTVEPVLLDISSKEQGENNIYIVKVSTLSR